MQQIPVLVLALPSGEKVEIDRAPLTGPPLELIGPPCSGVPVLVVDVIIHAKK
ncbi:MAG: hypothetical protein ACFFCW_05205 [Candidatus Hodarchaeota archaeon]